MKLLTILFFAFIVNIHAQKKNQRLDSYTATNGISYNVGDEIPLGRGSGINGRFVFVKIGGWTGATGENAGLPAVNAGLTVTIKKIRKLNYKRWKGVYLTVGGGNITNYEIDLENAIGTCEITPCEKQSGQVVVKEKKDDKYDKLIKLKKLLDQNVLTQEEYEAEKKKILETED